MKLSSQQRHVMALGMDSRMPGYRNFFAADPGGDDDVVWAGLAARGLATKALFADETIRHNWWVVTDRGKRAVGLVEQDEQR